MDQAAIKQPLTQYLDNLHRSVNVDQMIVFGSYARGMAGVDSDIDVLVVSDDFKKISTDKWLDVVDQAARGIEPEIQAWPLTCEQLDEADELTTVGQARIKGIRFVG